MKIVIVDSADRQKALEETLKAQWKDSDIVRLRENKPAAISAASPDLLISFDLDGFENTTLTDSIYYNLLCCKQIHFMLHENPKKEYVFQKPLSIAMFFYCAEERYYEYLHNTFPQIPYIKLMDNRSSIGSGAYDENLKPMLRAVSEVMTECGLI